jgi:hypothetical protein
MKAAAGGVGGQLKARTPPDAKMSQIQRVVAGRI